MASVTVLKAIGILVVSVILGIGLFYIAFTSSKDKKKQQIEATLSYGIQFIIYLWIGKIIVSFPKVMQDPLAVLAHPASSKAFYVATFFTFLHIIIQTRRGKIKGAALLEGFVPVFFTTSFFYGFMQIATGEIQLNAYFVWVTLLNIAIVLIYQKYPSAVNGSIFMVIWAIGACILSFKQGYLVLFDFLLQPIYFIGLGLFFIGYVWIVKRNGKVIET